MAEAYSMISVPRKNNNAGRASGKKSYIIISDGMMLRHLPRMKRCEGYCL